MHTITIKQIHNGQFDVLLNGHSYRIHRGLDEASAARIAGEARDQFRSMRQRASIQRV